VKISMPFSSNPGLHNSIHFENFQYHTPPAAAPQYVVSVNDDQPTFLSSLPTLAISLNSTPYSKQIIGQCCAAATCLSLVKRGYILV